MMDPPWPHGDPDVVVRAILRQRVFGHSPPGDQRTQAASLWSTLWTWFTHHVVQPLLAPFSHAFAVSREFGSALAVALIVLAIAGLSAASVRLALAFAAPRSIPRPGAPTHALPVELSCLQWRALGVAAAARGEHAQAIAAFFAAALAALDEHAVVMLGASRTPGEYGRIVRRSRAAAAPAFEDLAARFCRAAYGAAAPQADDSACARRALDALGPNLSA